MAALAHSRPPPGLARAVTFLVAGAFFMEQLDGTVITTALPAIGRAFGVDAVAINVGVTAYLLALAVFIPISGWLADRFGGRTVFGGAVALFTLSSLLCGLGDGLASFAAARVLQGAGGAAMVPVGRLIVLRMTDKAELVRAIGTIVWPALVAPVLGPPLGGFIVLHFSWRWIFFLNLPLGAVALALTVLLIPNERPEGEQRRLDLPGFVLTGAALALIVYGLDALGGGGGVTPLAFLLIGLALGVAGVLHLRRTPTPLLDLSPIAIPTFAVVVWGGSLLRMGIGSLPFLLPLLFQLAFGLNALQAGALVLWVFAGNLVMKAFTTRILRRFGFRRVMLVNGLLAAAGVAACALIGPTTPYWLIAVVLFLGGAFRSMQFTCLATIQFADVPPERLSDANTLAAMLQQLSFGLGVVVGAELLRLSAWARGHGGGAPDLTDFRAAFVAVTAIALIGLLDSMRLSAEAGRHVSGQGA